MSAALSSDALDQMFRAARTHNAFSGPVTEDDLKAIFDLMKWGPTGANSCPARFRFIRSAEAKEALRATLQPGNIDKTMAAPVTALIGYDLEFYEHLPRLFPHADAKSWFVGNEPSISHNAFMNASLQAGYFILAARALGFDCGPMSGFDSDKADAAFFAGTKIKSFMLVNLGHGNPAKVYPRGPRFEFAEVCKVV
jgi:3-hydroxypropanoate dehydrogenase